jgi:hypothetical protein
VDHQVSMYAVFAFRLVVCVLLEQRVSVYDATLIV